MSEALTTTEKPKDYPLPEAGTKRLNIRKAMAGIYVLQGHGSMFQCLVKAGFSRATARIQTQAGLSAESCIAEAAKLDSSLAPAKLLETGRRRLAESMAFIDPAKAPLRDVVRMFEATEKYFGGHEIQPQNASLALAERLAGIAALHAVARERGLPVPPLSEPFVEAEVVATGSIPAATGVTASALTPDGTTR